MTSQSSKFLKIPDDAILLALIERTPGMPELKFNWPGSGKVCWRYKIYKSDQSDCSISLSSNYC